jgi:hypothetical protein
MFNKKGDNWYRVGKHGKRGKGFSDK